MIPEKKSEPPKIDTQQMVFLWRTATFNINQRKKEKQGEKI